METAHTKVRILDIGPRHHDQRLDNFLLSQLKGVPKSLVYKLLRSGQVRVNKGRKKPDYRLQQGDQVRIPPVDTTEKDPSRVPAWLLDRLADSMLYEDASLLVLNKPAGVAVHAGSNVSHGVIEALRQLKPEYEALELVHRLDRDTSGCLVLAKTRPVLMQLHDLFRQDRGLQKIYRALLMGRWQGGERLVDAPLLKNTLQGGERMVQVDATGKPARSLFNPLAYYPAATLAEIELFTGRTHQIRVHAAHIGHPVAGDPKYGDNAFNQHLKQLGFKRMYLHAWKLSFTLDRAYSFTAPLDAEWERLMQQLDTQNPE